MFRAGRGRPPPGRASLARATPWGPRGSNEPDGNPGACTDRRQHSAPGAPSTPEVSGGPSTARSIHVQLHAGPHGTHCGAITNPRPIAPGNRAKAEAALLPDGGLPCGRYRRFVAVRVVDERAGCAPSWRYAGRLVRGGGPDRSLRRGSDRSRRDGGAGHGAGTIRSTTADPLGLATIQQSIRAADYRGDRVRLSGFVKSGPGSVGATSGLWMRVDGPAGSESIDFMEGRAIEQGTDWTRYDVVLDVPRNAVGLSFGALLFRWGPMWLDDVALERVGREVPLTGRAGQVLPVGTSSTDLRAEVLRRNGR